MESVESSKELPELRFIKPLYSNISINGIKKFIDEVPFFLNHYYFSELKVIFRFSFLTLFSWSAILGSAKFTLSKF